MDQRSIDAWPFERMNRSRFGQIGSSGSNCMTRFQMVYTNGASAIGVPGCPDLACCTASIERVRIVFIDSLSNSSLVIHLSFKILLGRGSCRLSDGARKSRTYFFIRLAEPESRKPFPNQPLAQTAQMAFGLTEFRR